MRKSFSCNNYINHDQYYDNNDEQSERNNAILNKSVISEGNNYTSTEVPTGNKPNYTRSGRLIKPRNILDL